MVSHFSGDFDSVMVMVVVAGVNGQWAMEKT
jgi:hypothetical protein